MDYMNEIERAKTAINEAMKDLKVLTENLPDGPAKLRALNATTSLVTASLAIDFRRPAVPCRLDFVAGEK